MADISPIDSANPAVQAAVASATNAAQSAALTSTPPPASAPSAPADTTAVFNALGLGSSVSTTA